MEHCVLKENELVMVSDELGDTAAGRRRLGLYYRDTRYLSLFEMTINEQRPRLLSSSNEQNYVCDIQLANPTIELPDGNTALARTISIRRSRFLKDGLHERISFYNHNRFAVPLKVTITFGSDFCDIFEVRGWDRKKRGTVNPPTFSNSRLTLSYEGLDGVKRYTEILLDVAPSRVEIEERPPEPILRRSSTFIPEATDIATMTVYHPSSAVLSWDLTLMPGKSHSISLQIVPGEGELTPSTETFNKSLSQLRNSYQDWLSQCTKLETDNELFNRLIERSARDLRLLLESTPEGLVPAAGIPWFACIFGRDSLITSLQTLMLNPQIAIGTLRFLAKHQGKKVDPWHDEEPGRILHEMRKGEMAKLGEIPHGAYYGSVDSTPLFLILFAETMKWLDDDRLYQEILPAAKLAIEWMERYGDLDGDGYLEYLTRSSGGIRNQGWKDGHSAITYPDGTPVEPPLALVEVQGYAYRAMREMAELLHHKGEASFAQELSQRAARLKENFNRDFWLENKRLFAQGLDPKKRPVETMTSNPGHCLFCDIVDEEKARHLVLRLTSTDMASGWGIRTVSSRSSKYNPMSYHNGSIWPHDNSLIVAGMRRYGYHWEAEEITTQLFQASLFFPYSRLPELFCGFSRDREAHSAPAEYPVSCSPQAWAAGSAILLFQSMLGLRVDAASKRLFLTPKLPEWLKQASVRNLRVGQGTIDLHFERHGEDTSFQITENEAGFEVVIPSR
ncbi:MAG: amylo-alpha-1,6-glucosidase [Chloroflexi bacterium]|nr:amylo-alpha-1,6-glucosidase [Chloroflexota bacterium]